MKDSSLPRRRRTKLKLLVSFNGALCRRPPSRKLRYVGGETRIISVERNTSLSKLESKIADLICPNASFSKFCLKYQVSESFCGGDGEEDGPVLGLLESEDDLRGMIEEYETMELRGKLHRRVWIFVFNTNDGFNDSAFVDKHVLYVKGDRFCRENNEYVKALGEGLGGENKNGSENFYVLFKKYESKAKKLGDDSLRKMVLKQQLLVKILNGIRVFRHYREQSDTELADENGICQSSPKQLCSELGSPSSSESKNLNFSGDQYSDNLSDFKLTNDRMMTSDSSGKISLVTESNSGPLNGLYPNFRLGNVDLELSKNMIRENIMPQSSYVNMINMGLAPLTWHNPSISGVYPMQSLQSTESQQRGHRGSIRHHRFGISEARNQRTYPYHIKNRSNVSELGNLQSFRLNGKSWIGKFYPGLRSSSNIAKQGPLSRSQSTTLRKPLYYAMQGEEGIMDHGHMFNPAYCGEENLLKPVGLIVPQHETANLDGGPVAHAGNDKSLLSIDANGNSFLGARTLDVHIDLFTSSGIQKIDIAGQALGEYCLDVVGMDGQTPLDYIEEPCSKNQGEVVNLSNSSHNPCNSIGTKLTADDKLLDVKGSHEKLGISQEGAKDLKNSGASVFNLSLHNLSLESSGKPPVPSPGRDMSEACQKPQSNGLDLMDEEHINLEPKFEKSSDISSDSLQNNVSKCKSDDDKREAIQQNPKFSSSITEKDENKKTSSSLKVNDGTPADISALYTHLATRELQIIENADLEYIKELGQGTYGTVYHGKWKGSDVAIKRIKPSCFTDGAKEEDRLVADFWKEAHILGQLHHPNIVALYGVVIDGPVNCLATVTEYMVNGSLKQVLRKKDRTIDRRKRLILALDAAFGMEYLHGKNIVHFDLKSHNFLVNMRDPQRPVCKIGDLGLSKIKQRTLVSGGIRGTIPWMAPELLSGRNLVSEKVDVFSFGIVMWELLTCEEPYANMRSEEIIGGIIRGNLRPEIPSWCDPAWRSLMERCWSSNPDCRPSFSEIAKELRAMAASMNIK